MLQLFPFFIILLAGLFFSALFRRLHLPLVVALIIAGIAIGPHGLEILTPVEFDPYRFDETLEFLGRIGLVFLMFLVGLEIKLSSFKEMRKEISILTLMNGGIPFLTGVAVGFMLGFEWFTALLLGIIFLSSSVAVISASLEGVGLTKARLGKAVIGTAVVQDVLSLVVLSILLHLVSPTAGDIPFPLYIGLLIFVVFGLRWIVPRLKKLLIPEDAEEEGGIFQQELRLVITILIGTVAIFELFGFHDIVAGFFAGLILSESMDNIALRAKFRAIGYGFFIPLFFILVGLKTDISVFADVADTFFLVCVIMASLISVKFVTGWLGGRLAGFTNDESKVIGTSTISQLFTTLAVVFAGAELGLLEPQLVTTLILLSITTTFIAPILISRYGKQIEATPLEEKHQDYLNTPASTAPDETQLQHES